MTWLPLSIASLLITVFQKGEFSRYSRDSGGLQHGIYNRICLGFCLVDECSADSNTFVEQTGESLACRLVKHIASDEALSDVLDDVHIISALRWARSTNNVRKKYEDSCHRIRQVELNYVGLNRWMTTLLADTMSSIYLKNTSSPERAAWRASSNETI